jgi:undecaprenyl-diphosphatase
VKEFTLKLPLHPVHREFVILGGLAGTFMLLLLTVVLWAPSGFDRAVGGAIQSIPWHGFRFVPRFGSDLGGGVYGAFLAPAAIGAFLATTRRWKLLALLGAVFLLHYVLISPKLFITAYRPSPVFGVEGAGGLESFPSGHVQWAVSFYGLLAYLAVERLQGARARALVVATYALIVLMTMVGRIELGRHWPTDTLAGVLAGLIALRLLVALHRWPRLERWLSKPAPAA